jgi:hypothetical protein
MSAVETATSGTASSWSGLFQGLLGQVVDTGAKLAAQNADTQQKKVVAEQTTATETAKANAAASTASAAQANASTNWQRIALFAGLGIAGLVGVVLVVRALKK